MGIVFIPHNQGGFQYSLSDQGQTLLSKRLNWSRSILYKINRYNPMINTTELMDYVQHPTNYICIRGTEHFASNGENINCYYTFKYYTHTKDGLIASHDHHLYSRYPLHWFYPDSLEENPYDRQVEIINNIYWDLYNIRYDITYVKTKPQQSNKSSRLSVTASEFRPRTKGGRKR
jgi:hypothetical protein